MTDRQASVNANTGADADSGPGTADDTGAVRLSRRDAVAHITFDRPAARNAMTWSMYESLGEICEQLAADRSVRVVVMRGAGGKAFIAGTDIEQFLSFDSGEDGVHYERQIGRFVGLVAALPMPTLAVVEGWAVGGGMALANACDFRIATVGARFGVPIARTLGNCLSMASVAGLVATLGPALVRRIVMLADMPQAEELMAVGYVTSVVAPAELDRAVDALVARLLGHAPITMAVTKSLLARLHRGDSTDEDLLRLCYGSDDFREGVRAFVAKRPPHWQGR